MVAKGRGRPALRPSGIVRTTRPAAPSAMEPSGHRQNQSGASHVCVATGLPTRTGFDSTRDSVRPADRLSRHNAALRFTQRSGLSLRLIFDVTRCVRDAPRLDTSPITARPGAINARVAASSWRGTGNTHTVPAFSWQDVDATLATHGIFAQSPRRHTCSKESWPSWP